MDIVNGSGYVFFSLPEEKLPMIKRELEEKLGALNVLGTILLSPEGINCMLAGTQDQIARSVIVVRDVVGLSGFGLKESLSQFNPFRRLFIKLKDEIIPMDDALVSGRSAIPWEYTGPTVPPRTLKQWLDRGTDDQGRPVVMLDTRNGYEIDEGTFSGAIDLKLNHFRDFPAALDTVFAPTIGSAQDFENKTVVMFCTGGVRCEKASVAMIRRGYRNVYQLEGGILKYFEEVGGDHYQGGCFVFDERVSVDPKLEPKVNSRTFSEATGA